MKLLIDAGNTRIKWQLRDGEQVLQSGAGDLESADLFDELQPAQWRRLVAIAVSTVRSEAAREQLERSIAAHTPVPVRFFWTTGQFRQLSCAYDDPATMGADRWHALIGAWQHVGGACLVVDAGSAITLDWLDDSGQHVGGYILPGRRMMAGSLRQSTARVLFGDDASLVDTRPGHSTAECVFHGINWLVQVLSLEIARQPVPVLITGGDGSLIRRALDAAGIRSSATIEYSPGLVFDGLALVEAG